MKMEVLKYFKVFNRIGAYSVTKCPLITAVSHRLLSSHRQLTFNHLSTFSNKITKINLNIRKFSVLEQCQTLKSPLSSYQQHFKNKFCIHTNTRLDNNVCMTTRFRKCLSSKLNLSNVAITQQNMRFLEKNTKNCVHLRARCLMPFLERNRPMFNCYNLANTEHFAKTMNIKNIMCNNHMNFVRTLHKTVKDQEDSQRKQTTEPVIEKENILTVPNLLTMSRILLTPYLGYLVLTESFPLACIIFSIAGITDLLDGWIARNFKNQTTAFGSFLDPLADKILVSMLYVTLSVVDVIPVALTALVIVRDIGLIAAAFYIRYVSLPSPRTMKQYFNGANVSAQLKPLLISKVNTALQLTLVAVSLAAPVFGYLDHTLLHILWYTTAGTTMASGIGYMVAKDTFQIMKNIGKKT